LTNGQQCTRPSGTIGKWCPPHSQRSKYLLFSAAVAHLVLLRLLKCTGPYSHANFVCQSGEHTSTQCACYAVLNVSSHTRAAGVQACVAVEGWHGGDEAVRIMPRSNSAGACAARPFIATAVEALTNSAKANRGASGPPAAHKFTKLGCISSLFEAVLPLTATYFEFCPSAPPQLPRTQQPPAHDRRAFALHSRQYLSSQPWIRPRCATAPRGGLRARFRSSPTRRRHRSSATAAQIRRVLQQTTSQVVVCCLFWSFRGVSISLRCDRPSQGRQGNAAPPSQPFDDVTFYAVE
jgi:hypothetical protein